MKTVELELEGTIEDEHSVANGRQLAAVAADQVSLNLAECMSCALTIVDHIDPKNPIDLNNLDRLVDALQMMDSWHARMHAVYLVMDYVLDSFDYDTSSRFFYEWWARFTFTDLICVAWDDNYADDQLNIPQRLLEYGIEQGLDDAITAHESKIDALYTKLNAMSLRVNRSYMHFKTGLSMLRSAMLPLYFFALRANSTARAQRYWQDYSRFPMDEQLLAIHVEKMIKNQHVDLQWHYNGTNRKEVAIFYQLLLVNVLLHPKVMRQRTSSITLVLWQRFGSVFADATEFEPESYDRLMTAFVQALLFLPTQDNKIFDRILWDYVENCIQHKRPLFGTNRQQALAIGLAVRVPVFHNVLENLCLEFLDSLLAGLDRVNRVFLGEDRKSMFAAITAKIQQELTVFAAEELDQSAAATVDEHMWKLVAALPRLASGEKDYFDHTIDQYLAICKKQQRPLFGVMRTKALAMGLRLRLSAFNAVLDYDLLQEFRLPILAGINADNSHEVILDGQPIFNKLSLEDRLECLRLSPELALLVPGWKEDISFLQTALQANPNLLKKLKKAQALLLRKQPEALVRLVVQDPRLWVMVCKLLFPRDFIVVASDSLLSRCEQYDPYCYHWISKMYVLYAQQCIVSNAALGFFHHVAGLDKYAHTVRGFEQTCRALDHFINVDHGHLNTQFQYPNQRVWEGLSAVLKQNHAKITSLLVRYGGLSLRRRPRDGWSAYRKKKRKSQNTWPMDEVALILGDMPCRAMIDELGRLVVIPKSKLGMKRLHRGGYKTVEQVLILQANPSGEIAFLPDRLLVTIHADKDNGGPNLGEIEDFLSLGSATRTDSDWLLVNNTSTYLVPDYGRAFRGVIEDWNIPWLDVAGGLTKAQVSEQFVAQVLGFFKSFHQQHRVFMDFKRDNLCCEVNASGITFRVIDKPAAVNSQRRLRNNLIQCGETPLANTRLNTCLWPSVRSDDQPLRRWWQNCQMSGDYQQTLSDLFAFKRSSYLASIPQEWMGVHDIWAILSVLDKFGDFLNSNDGEMKKITRSCSECFFNALVSTLRETTNCADVYLRMQPYDINWLIAQFRPMLAVDAFIDEQSIWQQWWRSRFAKVVALWAQLRPKQQKIAALRRWQHAAVSSCSFDSLPAVAVQQQPGFSANVVEMSSPGLPDQDAADYGIRAEISPADVITQAAQEEHQGLPIIVESHPSLSRSSVTADNHAAKEQAEHDGGANPRHVQLS